MDNTAAATSNTNSLLSTNGNVEISPQSRAHLQILEAQRAELLWSGERNEQLLQEKQQLLEKLNVEASRKIPPAATVDRSVDIPTIGSLSSFYRESISAKHIELSLVRQKRIDLENELKKLESKIVELGAPIVYMTSGTIDSNLPSPKTQSRTHLQLLSAKQLDRNIDIKFDGQIPSSDEFKQAAEVELKQLLLETKAKAAALGRLDILSQSVTTSQIVDASKALSNDNVKPCSGGGETTIEISSSNNTSCTSSKDNVADVIGIKAKESELQQSKITSMREARLQAEVSNKDNVLITSALPKISHIEINSSSNRVVDGGIKGPIEPGEGTGPITHITNTSPTESAPIAAEAVAAESFTQFPASPKGTAAASNRYEELLMEKQKALDVARSQRMQAANELAHLQSLLSSKES